jgi:type I restriction enzyme R subunit
VYSSNQDEQSAPSLNDGLTEEKILERFALKKNGIIIVVAKLQTGFDEKRLHTLFLDKEIKGISAIQTISRVNRTTKHKNDCKIIDFSYDNVNVQNIHDAFEHFSDVVVSDFDPLGDEKVLAVLLTTLYQSDVYSQFFYAFTAIYNDKIKRDNPESYLDFENSVKKYIDANPKRAADAKAKAAQYFTILNRIEYVIDLNEKYSVQSFLFFWRKFTMFYNLLQQHREYKDPIDVYFDNQIGIIEVMAAEPEKKQKKRTIIAEGKSPHYGQAATFDILSIIAARNTEEAKKGELISEFETKISALFAYICADKAGKRLIVKLKSSVAEDEIYDDFAKIYRRYRAFNRRTVGDFFFKQTDDLCNNLCDDFMKKVTADKIGE